MPLGQGLDLWVSDEFHLLRPQAWTMALFTT
jgi:hypothetical protein